MYIHPKNCPTPIQSELSLINALLTQREKRGWLDEPENQLHESNRKDILLCGRVCFLLNQSTAIFQVMVRKASFQNHRHCVIAIFCNASDR